LATAGPTRKEADYLAHIEHWTFDNELYIGRLGS
jgi:hypothetical protein